MYRGTPEIVKGDFAIKIIKKIFIKKLTCSLSPPHPEGDPCTARAHGARVNRNSRILAGTEEEFTNLSDVIHFSSMCVRL